MGRSRTARVAAAMLAFAVLGASCSSGGGKHAPSTTTTSAPSGPVLGPGTAGKRLLRATDLGESFVAATFVTFTAPLPCDTKDAAAAQKRTGATYFLGRQFQSAKPKAGIREAVLGFRSAAAARAAMLTLRDDMQCITGHEYPAGHQPVTVLLGPESDVSKTIGSPQAYSWALTTISERGAYVAMVADSTVVLLRVSIDVHDLASGGKLPDGPKIAATAYTRMTKG